ncbi:MAG: PAS domain S-box protein [Gemmatimonadota bacterium]
MSGPAANAPNQLRLLLIEDNPADADLVQEYLEDVGEEVPRLAIAASIGAATDVLAAAEFEAVLLDLNLPDSLGLESLERMLSTASAPVIVLTGGAGDEMGVEAVARGAADFLPKSELTGRLLLRSVKYAVERHRRRGVEARYRALVENSRDLVLILDADLGIQYASPSLFEILGYEPEEKIGTSAALEIHPQDMERVRRELSRSLHDPNYTSHLDYRVRRRDESWCVLDTITQNCFHEPQIGGLVVNARDVTDLRQAEETAVRTARQLERTLGAVEDAVFTLETPGRTILACNPGAELMFGFAEDEMVGRSTDFLFPDEDSFQRFFDEALPRLEPGEAYHAEPRMLRRDGTTFPAEVGVTLLHPERGVEGGFVSVIRDITERVEQARQVRFQAALLQQVGQPILAVDQYDRVAYWNDAAAELSGYSSAEVEGRDIVDIIVHDQDRDAAKSARAVSFTTGRWQGEVRIRKKDGSVAIVQATSSPAVNPDGSPGGRITAGVDVTSLRRAEEASRQLAERMRFQAEMLEAVGQAVIATDVEGRITYWNHAAEELYGWSRDEAIGKSILEVTPTTANVEQAEEILRTLTSGDIWTGEFEVSRRDGSTFNALVTDAPIHDEEGRLLGIIGVSSDISERKALEGQLRQAQKMEAIGRLAGGIAHDFNNLLTAIEGHTSFLLSELPEDSPLREDVEEILKSGRRAADLTGQLLTFSRKQVLQERSVALNREADGLRGMLRRLVPARIDFQMKTGTEDIVVHADPGQIQQVVMNLLLNAVDAVENAGSIVLEIDEIMLSEEDAERIPWEVRPGRYACLTVSDTGSGIDPAALPHIFEPFFTTKPEGHGTGLGLATVYGIVKQSQGHVLVDSAPGDGTTFRVLLPRIEQEAEEPRPPTRPAEATNGAVVLLVEDDEAVRSIGRRILSRAGYTVLEAPNGVEALERVAGGAKVDLVISDIVMPELGGVELQQRLRTERPGIKMILTSGYSASDVHGEIRESGLPFLAKPFTPDALLRCVAECLAHGQEAESSRN